MDVLLCIIDYYHLTDFAEPDPNQTRMMETEMVGRLRNG